MKAEDTTAPAAAPTPATPQPAAPAAQTYTSQWAASTLQQTPTGAQYYQAYASHYPQAAYATHYQTYAPPAPTPTAQQTTQQAAQQPAARTPAPTYSTSTYAVSTATTSSTAAATPAAAASGGMDTADIATLNDALGSAGVDLRAEEESLQRPADAHQAYRAYEDRTRKQPPRPAFDTAVLSGLMRTAATPHKVTRVPDDAVAYLALALRARLTALVEAMIAAAQHRTEAQLSRAPGMYAPDAPMWNAVVKRDIGKQLAALEKAEREDELRARKERKERAELAAAHAAALAAQAGGATAPSVATAGADGEAAEGEGTAKKKRKKDGPGVTARNMSEDVRKKMSNAVATQAAGLGGKYAWMNAANAGGPAVKPKAAASTAATTTATTTSTTAAAGATTSTATPAAASPAPATTSSWARPYVSTKKPAGTTAKDGATGAAAEEDSRTCITMRDALFVVTGERGHGGGRGAARGWI